jgi:hypothetical protein
VYRALQASLSRYSCLSRLELGFTPRRAPQLQQHHQLAISSTLAPLDTKTANQALKPPQPIIVTSEPEPEVASQLGAPLTAVTSTTSDNSTTPSVTSSAATDDILHEATSSTDGVQMINAFPLPPPSPFEFVFPSRPASSVFSKRISQVPGSGFVKPSKALAGDEEREGGTLAPQEQAKAEMWVRQCPTLRSIVLAGGRVWNNPSFS